MHLQDAYFAEKDEIGKGSEIGFKAPASNVFDYSTIDGASLFTATNKSALDDCAANSSWTVTPSKGGEGGGLKHVAAITGDNCEPLTPSFTSIGAGTHD